MKSLSPYTFIHTGLLIRMLRQLQVAEISLVIGATTELRANLIGAGFAVAAAGLDQLEGLAKRFSKEVNKKRSLTPAERSELSEIMGVIEQMVFAEAHTKKIFVISEKRYNLDCLMEHQAKMFKDGIFFKLPGIARRDLVEGFRCIGFNMSTAAAFHILRATESVLREYYLVKIKRGRDKVLLWGKMTVALAAKRDGDSKLLQRLDYLKNAYRNPTSHPDAEYNLEEVQDLLGLCIDVINAMGHEIPQKDPLAELY